MERLITTHAELTGQARNAYSSGRGNFMPDGNSISPDNLSQPDLRSQEAPGSPALGQEVLMQKWLSYLGRENQSPDVTRLVEGLVNSRVRPEHGSLTVDEAVVKKAEAVLGGKKLTEVQRTGLTAVHLVGEGELGRDGTPAKVGNYTQRQIAEKGRMLDMLGFTPDEARDLMDKEVVGMQPPTPEGRNPHDDEIDAVIKDPETNTRTTIMPSTFTDAEFRSIAEKIQNSYNSDHLSKASLLRFFDQANKHATEGTGVDLSEARRLEVGIRKLVELDEARLGGRERAQRQGRGEDPRALRYKEISDQINAARQAGDNTAVERLTTERKAFVKELAQTINVQNGITEDILKMIIDEENSLDYLVDRIISPPLDAETGDWQLGFYGQQNLDSIINILRNQIETGTTEDIRKRRQVQYTSVQEIEESARLLHTINKSIINSDLKTLSGLAGSMTDERLTRLSRIKGVGAVVRLLEAEYGSLLAKDGWINGKNYAALTGKVKNDQTGLIEEDQEQSALTSFKKMVEFAKARVAVNQNDPTITDQMRELAQMEDWQVSWAFNIGKSMQNLWLRGAEWISQGIVPEGDKGYVSFPQESMARILNYPQWMLERFGISESRGGTKWLEMALASHQAIREEQGYGKMDLVKIGGKKIENFEMPDMIGVRGWWATWREKQLLMSTMQMQFTPRGAIAGARITREGIPVNPNDVTNLGVLLDTGAVSIEARGYSGPLGKAPENMQVDYWKSIFLDGNDNIRGDFKMGLGASLFFLKPSGGEKNHALNTAKNEIRRKIWEKAAEENPLGLVPYLHGLEYRNGQTVSFVPGPDATQQEKDAWRSFERKLYQLNEMKMQRIRGFDRALAGQDPNISRDDALRGLGDVSLVGLIAEENARADGIKLDATERRWLETIRDKGRDAAPHLANVRFEYNPFLNDTPMEKLDYSVIGHEGYRRMLGDTSGFQEAEGALISLMDNPSKFTEPEQIFEALEPFIRGVGGILGTRDGQAKGWLWLRNTLEFYERGGIAKGPLEKRIRQLPFVNEFLKSAHKPNSIAQEWAGIEAANWDAQQIYKAGEEAVHKGVINEHLFDDWKKRFGGRRTVFLIKLMRGLAMAIFAGVLETGSKTVKAGTEDVGLE